MKGAGRKNILSGLFLLFIKQPLNSDPLTGSPHLHKQYKLQEPSTDTSIANKITGNSGRHESSITKLLSSGWLAHIRPALTTPI
jgi:hypothetical protein